MPHCAVSVCLNIRKEDICYYYFFVQFKICMYFLKKKINRSVNIHRKQSLFCFDKHVLVL